MARRTEQLTFRVSKDVKRRLKAVCKEREISASDVLNIGVKQILPRLESGEEVLGN